MRRRNDWRREAGRLGVRMERLAEAALSDLLSATDADFEAAARHILTKNRNLYRRLAR